METAPKIMVVDDEKSICSNVEKILKKNNYEVVHAMSADEALELSLIHISEPTRPVGISRMPSSA